MSVSLPFIPLQPGPQAGVAPLSTDVAGEVTGNFGLPLPGEGFGQVLSAMAVPQAKQGFQLPMQGQQQQQAAPLMNAVAQTLPPSTGVVLSSAPVAQTTPVVTGEIKDIGLESSKPAVVVDPAMSQETEPFVVPDIPVASVLVATPVQVVMTTLPKGTGVVSKAFAGSVNSETAQSLVQNEPEITQKFDANGNILCPTQIEVNEAVQAQEILSNTQSTAPAAEMPVLPLPAKAVTADRAADQKSVLVDETKVSTLTERSGPVSDIQASATSQKQEALPTSQDQVTRSVMPAVGEEPVPVMKDSSVVENATADSVAPVVMAMPAPAKDTTAQATASAPVVAPAPEVKISPKASNNVERGENQSVTVKAATLDSIPATGCIVESGSNQSVQTKGVALQGTRRSGKENSAANDTQVDAQAATDIPTVAASLAVASSSAMPVTEKVKAGKTEPSNPQAVKPRKGEQKQAAKTASEPLTQNVVVTVPAPEQVSVSIPSAVQAQAETPSDNLEVQAAPAAEISNGVRGMVAPSGSGQTGGGTSTAKVQANPANPDDTAARSMTDSESALGGRQDEARQQGGGRSLSAVKAKILPVDQNNSSTAASSFGLNQSQVASPVSANQTRMASNVVTPQAVEAMPAVPSYANVASAPRIVVKEPEPLAGKPVVQDQSPVAVADTVQAAVQTLSKVASTSSSSVDVVTAQASEPVEGEATVVAAGPAVVREQSSPKPVISVDVTVNADKGATMPKQETVSSRTPALHTSGGQVFAENSGKYGDLIRAASKYSLPVDQGARGYGIAQSSNTQPTAISVSAQTQGSSVKVASVAPAAQQIPVLANKTSTKSSALFATVAADSPADAEQVPTVVVAQVVQASVAPEMNAADQAVVNSALESAGFSIAAVRGDTKNAVVQTGQIRPQTKARQSEGKAQTLASTSESAPKAEVASSQTDGASPKIMSSFASRRDLQTTPVAPAQVAERNPQVTSGATPSAEAPEATGPKQAASAAVTEAAAADASVSVPQSSSKTPTQGQIDPAKIAAQQGVVAQAKVSASQGSNKRNSQQEGDKKDTKEQKADGISSAQKSPTMYTDDSEKLTSRSSSEPVDTAVMSVHSAHKIETAKPVVTQESVLKEPVGRTMGVIRDVVEKLQGKAERTVDFNLSFHTGERLSVSLEFRRGEVITTFKTNSTELRDTLSTEWQATMPAVLEGKDSIRLANPIFSQNSAQSGNGSNGLDGQTSRQSQQQAQQDQTASEPSHSFSFSRQSQKTTTEKPDTPTGQRPAMSDNSRRLQAFA